MMKCKYSPLLTLVIFLVALILAFGFLLWTHLQIEQSVSDGSMIPLSSQAPVGQTLLAHYPGLSRISIPAAGIAEDNLGEIQFQLSRLEPDGENLSVQHEEVTISRENDWVHFQFPPQDDEAGTQYVFYLKRTGESTILLRIFLTCTQRGDY